MGLFEDNRVREVRVGQLHGYISASNTLIAEHAENLVGSIQKLDSLLEKQTQLQKTGPIFEFPRMPLHWVPALSVMPPTPSGSLYRIKYMLSAVGYAGGSFLTWRALTPWVDSAITVAGAVAAVNAAGVGARGAVYVGQAQMANIRAGLPLWRRHGGWRFVGRAAAASATGIIFSVGTFILLEYYEDKISADELKEQIRKASIVRHIASYFEAQMGIYAQAYQTTIAQLEFAAKQGFKVDIDKILQQLINDLQAGTKELASLSQSVYVKNGTRDRGSYIVDDAKFEVLNEELNKAFATFSESSNGCLEEITVHSGWVVDSIQTRLRNNDPGLVWGGKGGDAKKVKITGHIKSISWQPAEYSGQKCIVDLVIETSTEKFHFAEERQPEINPSGERVVINIPTGWQVKDIIGTDQVLLAQNGDTTATNDAPFVRDIYIVGDLKQS
ncbi:jacalin-like lectin [Pseudomonas sp. NyZ201]|uniref:jacalin-like lectin n=1 Tax=Pseudomonas sp. NyZ201 TaxID=3409857 RepID=UPI003CEAD905